MKWPSFTILAVAVLLIQLSFAPVIALGRQGVVPDLILAVGIIIAFKSQSDENALLQCWILGLCHDFTSAVPFGVYAFLLSGIAAFITVMKKWLYLQNIYMMVLLTFVFVFLTESVAVLVLAVKHEIPISNLLAIENMNLFSSAYTAVAAPYFQFFIRKQKWNLQ